MACYARQLYMNDAVGANVWSMFIMVHVIDTSLAPVAIRVEGQRERTVALRAPVRRARDATAYEKRGSTETHVEVAVGCLLRNACMCLPHELQLMQRQDAATGHSFGQSVNGEHQHAQ